MLELERYNNLSLTLSFVLNCPFKLTLHTGNKLIRKLHFFSIYKQINPKIQILIQNQIHLFEDPLINLAILYIHSTFVAISLVNRVFL